MSRSVLVPVLTLLPVLSAWASPTGPVAAATPAARTDLRELLRDPVFQEKLRRWRSMSDAERSRVKSRYEQWRRLPELQRDCLRMSWARFRALKPEQQATAQAWFRDLPEEQRRSLKQVASRAYSFARMHQIPLHQFAGWVRNQPRDEIARVLQLPPDQRGEALQRLNRRFYEHILRNGKRSRPRSAASSRGGSACPVPARGLRRGSLPPTPRGSRRRRSFPIPPPDPPRPRAPTGAPCRRIIYVRRPVYSESGAGPHYGEAEMRIRVVTWASIAILLPLGVEAQRGGGGIRGGGGYGFGDNVPPPTWAASLESAFGQQKPIILYVCPALEAEDDYPGAFRNPEVSKASRAAAVFVRLPFKTGDPVIKERRIVSAPCLLGLDWFGNEWHRSASVSQSVVKEYIRLIPQEVAAYGEALARLLDQAKAREEKEDVKGALVAYKKLALEKRVGFEPITTARTKLKELGEKAIQDAVLLLTDPEKEKQGMQDLSSLSRDLSGTAVGALARLAQLKHGLAEAKDIRSRIPEIQKIAALEGDEYGEVRTVASSLVELLEGYGQARIEDALRKAGRGENDTAKTLLRQIQGDFAGLKVSDRAKEEMAKL